MSVWEQFEAENVGYRNASNYERQAIESCEHAYTSVTDTDAAYDREGNTIRGRIQELIVCSDCPLSVWEERALTSDELANERSDADFTGSDR